MMMTLMLLQLLLPGCPVSELLFTDTKVRVLQNQNPVRLIMMDRADAFIKRGGLLLKVIFRGPTL